MTQNEIQTIIEPFVKLYNWSLHSRAGNSNNDFSTYSYNYIDDAGIVITINPVTKEFSFKISVDYLFTLSSDAFSPIDYKNHFEMMYTRFRNLVITKNLH